MTESLEHRLATLEAELRSMQRRSQRTRRILFTAAVGTSLLGAVVAFAAPTPRACAHPNGLFCFSPDTPALATEVNTNFETLAAWLERKVGADATDPEAEPTGTGGLVVVGDVASLNLAIDTDEIDARSSGAAAPLYLQRGNAAGNVVVGTGGPNPAAKMQVGGAVSANAIESALLTLGGGTAMRKIATGTIGNCTSNSVPAGPATVSFGTTFLNAPLVWLQPEEPDASGCTSIRVKSRTTTSFEYQAWTGGTASPCDCVHWLAIGT